MTSRDQVKDIFISPMTDMFKAPPHVEDQAAVLSQYIAVLIHYEPDHLERAWNHLFRYHTRQTWPLMAEIQKALSATRPEKSENKPKTPKFDHEKHNPKRYWAKKAQESPAWPQAVAAGCPLAFIWEAQDRASMPFIEHVEIARQRWLAFLSSVEDTENDESRFSPLMAKIGQAMIDHNEKLINGKEH